MLESSVNRVIGRKAAAPPSTVSPGGSCKAYLNLKTALEKLTPVEKAHRLGHNSDQVRMGESAYEDHATVRG